MRKDQSQEFDRARAYDSSSLCRQAMDLVRCDFCELDLSKIKIDELIMWALTELDFNGIHESAAVPVIFVSSERDAFSLLPVCNSKRTCTDPASTGDFLGNAISRHRQFKGEIGIVGIRLDDDGIRGSQNRPVWIARSKRG